MALMGIVYYCVDCGCDLPVPKMRCQPCYMARLEEVSTQTERAWAERQAERRAAARAARAKAVAPKEAGK